MATSSPGLLEPWETNYLLPNSVRPQAYDILLQSNLASGKFSGRVRISVSMSKPMNYCLLHVDGLTIDYTSVRTEDGVLIKVDRAFEYRPNQFWVIITQDTLPPGVYQLEVGFRGSMLGKIEGLYLSSYSPLANSSDTR